MVRVSAIVTTYNRTEFLREALASVFAQTYPDLDVIAVDDGSTDDTVAVLETYGDRMTIVRRGTNSGTCELPRYEGTEACRGTYAAFLDSDDLWEPDKVEKQVAFLEKNPGIPLCHTYVRLIDDRGVEHGIRHENAIPPTGHCAAALLRHCFPCVSSVMVHRDAWLAAMPREEIVDFGMDWDFFLQIARNHPIGFLPEVLASYRRSRQSVSHARWRRTPRNVIAMERVLRKRYWEGVVPRRAFTDMITDAYLENARYHRDRGYPGRSARLMRDALRHRPLSPAVHAELARAMAQAAIPGLRPHVDAM